MVATSFEEATGFVCKQERNERKKEAAGPSQVLASAFEQAQDEVYVLYQHDEGYEQACPSFGTCALRFKRLRCSHGTEKGCLEPEARGRLEVGGMNTPDKPKNALVLLLFWLLLSFFVFAYSTLVFTLFLYFTFFTGYL